MNPYSKLVLNFMGIWIASSLINGLISGVLIILADHETGFFVIPFTMLFSFIFSIPFLFITFLIAAFLFSAKEKSDVFRIVLQVSLIVSITGAVICKSLFNEFKNAAIPLCATVVLSSVLAVMLFRNKLKKINKNQS